MSHRTIRTWLVVLLGLAGLVLTVLTPKHSLAEPLSPDTQIVVEPIADAEINTQGTSNGDGEALSVIINDIGQARALLRFDFASLLPPGAVVTKAELQLQQTQANNDLFTFSIRRIIEEWDEATVNFDNQPGSSTPGVANLTTPATTGQAVILDVTPLVQYWHSAPASNFGLIFVPNDSQAGRRAFASRESATPPKLVIEYAQTVAPVVAANTGSAPKFDGICDTNNDYADITPQYYAGPDGVAYPIYIKHTSTDLYICATGLNPDTGTPRAFSLYFDIDRSDGDSGRPQADQDDYRLRMSASDEVLDAGWGNGDNGYIQFADPSEFGDWDAQYSSNDTVESAEFRVSLETLRGYAPWCGAAVGLALRHENVRTLDDDFSWPQNANVLSPVTWPELHLQNPMCPIRVCVVDPDTDTCSASSTATVYRIDDGAAFGVDADGYIDVANRAAIGAGQQLWALHPLVQTERYTTYATNREPATVTWAAFNQAEPLGEMVVPVSSDDPLLVHDLSLSTQWALTTEQRARLAERVRTASHFLYSFTGGQVLLGQVTAYQHYDNWTDVDLWLYANHNMRPKATAGGVITAPLDDPGGAALTYYPGYIHMGRDWNRYQVPPGQPVVMDGVPLDPTMFKDDWSIVFAHEMGHYLFFLFDTYFGIDERSKVQDVYSCTGSAMGWVYEQGNWGLIGDPAHWDSLCSATQAHQVLGRDEWETIKLHYEWLDIPDSLVPGLRTPPVDLTQVTFVPPTNGQTLLENQVFDLAYQNGETASRKAHAFLYQGNRVVSQGRVAKGTTQIELVGAQAGDRFCVYDIDAAPPSPDTPRHQYGCEILEAGDTELTLERTPSWRPVVLVDPIGPTSFAISVTQAPPGAPLAARVYPEHMEAVFDVPLTSQGNRHTGQVDLLDVTPSAFVQIYVDESDSEADPRREAMAMFGVDGGTVPGPGSMGEQAPVYSPDGEALAWPLEALILEPGQWVSLQYMVETFPNQTGTPRVTDAYRAISWPPDLIDDLVVAVRIPDELATAQAAGVDPTAASAEPVFFIRYWNGETWQAVPTNRILGADGRYLASAIVPMGAPFAVFSGADGSYLPLLTTNPNP